MAQGEYPFNEFDHIRMSHDVRCFEDGSMWLIDEFGDPDFRDPDVAAAPVDAFGEPDDKGMRSVDIRRTDGLRVISGTGFKRLETVYHFGWDNFGKKMPETRTWSWSAIEGIPIQLIDDLIVNTPMMHQKGTNIPLYGAKRVYFANVAPGQEDTSGRKVAIKMVWAPTWFSPNGEPGYYFPVEVIKSRGMEVGTGFHYQVARFHSDIWADCDIAKDKYFEFVAKHPSFMKTATSLEPEPPI